ncbi:MAG: hypothetical protein V3T72_18760 [Thermoanaerobaculia bacterium]
MVSVRDSGWKFIAYTDARKFELYDLRQDPEESSNRAKDDPVTRSRYQTLLDRWLAATALEDPDELESDPEVMEQLRGLGYIQ